jgi:hypothetical protein
MTWSSVMCATVALQTVVSNEGLIIPEVSLKRVSYVNNLTRSTTHSQKLYRSLLIIPSSMFYHHRTQTLLLYTRSNKLPNGVRTQLPNAVDHFL